MISVRKKPMLFKAVFGSLPAVTMLLFSVFLIYTRLVAGIEHDLNMVSYMAGGPAAKPFEDSGLAENGRPELPGGIRQIAGFTPIRQPRLPDSIIQVEKRFAGRFSLGFSPGNFLSLGLCTVLGVLVFFFLRQRHVWGCRAGLIVQAPWFSVHPEDNHTDNSMMSTRDDILVDESETLASVNSEGSTFSVFWRRCRDLRTAGPKESGAAPEEEYTDPFILFFKTNSAASMDMARIISRLEKESGYLDMLKVYAFRTVLLLRDLGFQLPFEGKIGLDPLVETILDYYAITVHGIGKESESIAALETAKKAEELENAARKGDLAFLTENTPVFLEYMEYFITGIVKLTEEKNILNDRRLRAKRRVSDVPRRFGKQRGKKSD
jgi:hypothetical protein